MLDLSTIKQNLADVTRGHIASQPSTFIIPRKPSKHHFLSLPQLFMTDASYDKWLFFDGSLQNNVYPSLTNSSDEASNENAENPEVTACHKDYYCLGHLALRLEREHLIASLTWIARFIFPSNFP
jgi:hypothetical protein